MKNYKLEKLQNGETFITSEKGNSMIPLIKSGQKHKLAPVKWEDCNEDDIVYWSLLKVKLVMIKF